MKFQNCVLIIFNRGTDGRTEGRTDKPKAICPFNFSKVGGITIKPKQLALSLSFSLSFSHVTIIAELERI